MTLPTDRIRNKATLLHALAVAVAEGEFFPFDQAADFCVLQVDGGDVLASGTLTLALIPVAGETCRVGNQVYTLVAALSSPAVPNEVLVGATASILLDNLIAAINRDRAQEGTLFSEGTKENVDATVVAGAGDTMDATAREKGVAGNSTNTTETFAGAGNQWAAATLVGGTDFVGQVDFRATLDDRNFFNIEGLPIAGGAGVVVATAPGAFLINMAGIALFKAPITAHTSGEINVRILHRRKTQG